MKIYTKTGDAGITSLLGGTRVPKHHLRIDSYGTIDELNAHIGLVMAYDIEASHQQTLKHIQNNLFVLGSLLAAEPGASKMELPVIAEADVEALEESIDKMNTMIPELKHFILPGGNAVIAYCHIARCVCRRAERKVVRLSEDSEVEKIIIVYLNRLSDYLFVLARCIGYEKQIPEQIWTTRV